MPKSKENATRSPSKRGVRPALTPEARENQLISMAMNLAESKIMDGTASSQLIVHFLKLGSTKDRLEKEKLQRENELLKAKVRAIDSGKNIEKLFEDAMTMFGVYSGKTRMPEDDEDEEYDSY